MLKRKEARKRGKTGLSSVFLDLKMGDKVALVRNLSETADFPRRLQGKTGVIMESKGNSFMVKINDGKKPKMLVVKRINLKKLSN